MARLRVMSVNLLVDRADPDDLERVISVLDPDVLVVQELGPTTSATIGRLFPHGHLDARDDCFGLGIVARLPVAVEPLPLPVRSGWVATLDRDVWDLATGIDVLGVHLTNPIDRPWGASKEARRGQIEGISARVADSQGATIVVGDMNSTPRWPEYRLLARLGVDAARQTGTARRTWAHFTRGPRWIRIDHAFVAGADPVRTRTVRVMGTDHHALAVDIDV